MKSAQKLILSIFVLSAMSNSFGAEKYVPPSLTIKQDKPVVKIEKETVEDTKSFGQFEDKQERDVASNEDTARDPSSNGNKKVEEKSKAPFRPVPMRWKEKRD